MLSTIAKWFQPKKPDLSGLDSRSVAGGTEAEIPISLTGIRKSYLLGPVESEILKGIDLEVYRGDLLAIMGSSGCGKSTLMNIMGLMDQPSSGSCRLDGRSITEMTDDEQSELRNLSIGFVFQPSFLLTRLSALENVALPLAYRGIPAATTRILAEEMLDRVGMGDRLDHRPNQMSGGQQQRVAIARALIGHPSIILADEPTGALDAENAKEVMELFVKLNAEEHMTAVVVTHDREIANQCSRVVKLVDGRVAESSGYSTHSGLRQNV